MPASVARSSPRAVAAATERHRSLISTFGLRVRPCVADYVFVEQPASSSSAVFAGDQRGPRRVLNPLGPCVIFPERRQLERADELGDRQIRIVGLQRENTLLGDSR